MRLSVRALCCVHWSSSLSSAQAQFTALVGCVMPSRPHTTMVHRPVRRRGHCFVVAGLLRMAGPSRPDHPPRGADLAARMLSCGGARGGGCAAHRGPHNHFQLYPLLTEQVQLSMLQVRLLISPCSVLSLGTRFASPKTAEAGGYPNVEISRGLSSHVLSSESEVDRTASAVTLLALSVPEADHELR